jgi:hypothetical protein
MFFIDLVASSILHSIFQLLKNLYFRIRSLASSRFRTDLQHGIQSSQSSGQG